MKKLFVLTHFDRDMNLKLQRLPQSFKTVEEYHKEMGITMIQVRVKELIEATMARFLKYLNKEIANILNLQNYVDFKEIVHLTTKIERQLRDRGVTSGYISVTPQVTQRWV